MKSFINTLVAAAFAAAAAAPAFAGTSQLALNAGLTAAQAEGMSLTEIAQAKFNRDASRQTDRNAIRTPGSISPESITRIAAAAGLDADEAAGLTLNEAFVAKFNRGASGQDRQSVSPAHMSSRGPVDTGARGQLVASAGLTPEQGAGMTLNEIAVAKFNRGVSGQNRQ